MEQPLKFFARRSDRAGGESKLRLRGARERRGAHLDPVVATVILGTHPRREDTALGACTERGKRAGKAHPALVSCS